MGSNPRQDVKTSYVWASFKSIIIDQLWGCFSYSIFIMLSITIIDIWIVLLMWENEWYDKKKHFGSQVFDIFRLNVGPCLLICSGICAASAQHYWLLGLVRDTSCFMYHAYRNIVHGTLSPGSHTVTKQFCAASAISCFIMIIKKLISPWRRWWKYSNIKH